MRSIATIFAPVIVNATSVIGLPSAAMTTPAAPLINAGRVTWANGTPVSARPATAAAPRAASAPLQQTTTSGSSASSSASKSPLRTAVRNAPAIARCRLRSWVSRTGATPWTRRPAQLASCSARLSLVAVWREAKVFTDAGRAALELTDQGTRIADAAGGVTDEAWANAAKHYDDDQLAALVSLIAVINAYNALNVILQRPGGDYQPGQWG